MNKTLLGVIAGAAGAALLIGGGTFALWSQTATQAGGTITAGNLEIAAVAGGATWADVSPDRAAGEVPIADIATHRIVPGDVVEGKFGFSAALAGENLVATMTGAVDTATGALVTTTPGLTIAVTFETAAGAPLGTGGTANFTSLTNPAPGGLPTLPATLVPATANIIAVVTATFDETVSARDLVNATAALGTVSVELEQIRTGVGGFTP